MQVLLKFELLVQSLAFLRREPSGIVRTVLQQRENDNTQDHRWNAPEDVNALPALKTKQLRVMQRQTVNGFVGSDFEQRIGNLWTENLSDRGGHQKTGQRSRAVSAGKPVVR